MDQDPLVENENDIAKRTEAPQDDFDKGIEILERPPGGDFIAALKNFVIWIEKLVGKGK
jgi:hypothetical protein